MEVSTGRDRARDRIKGESCFWHVVGYEHDKCCMHNACREPCIVGGLLCADHELRFMGIEGCPSIHHPLMKPHREIAWEEKAKAHIPPLA